MSQDEINEFLDLTYREVLEYESKIDVLYSRHVKISKMLEEKSDYEFMLQRYWSHTKINLKGWMLDSDLCRLLENNGIIEYSIFDLKEYYKNYEIKKGIDCTKYIEAIELYLLMDEIETLIEEKIEKEMAAIWCIDEKIERIEDISNVVESQKTAFRTCLPNSDTVSADTTLFKSLYNMILKEIEKMRNETLISEEQYKYCIKFLNDTFNFYINYGEYIQTPEEYLYENE